MSDDDLSLDDLSDQTGVERRTLRSWVAEGLLSPPVKMGRGAMYPRANLDRALAILALRDIHGRSRAEIRERLLAADEQGVRGLAKEARSLSSLAVKGPATARDYLAGLRATAAGHEGSPPSPLVSSSKAPPQGGPVPASTAGLEALLAALEPWARVPNGIRARGASRYHIPITPDIELSVRGEISPQERAKLERIADLIRAILTGGATQ